MIKKTKNIAKAFFLVLCEKAKNIRVDISGLLTFFIFFSFFSACL